MEGRHARFPDPRVLNSFSGLDVGCVQTRRDRPYVCAPDLKWSRRVLIPSERPAGTARTAFSTRRARSAATQRVEYVVVMAAPSAPAVRTSAVCQPFCALAGGVSRRRTLRASCMALLAFRAPEATSPLGRWRRQPTPVLRLLAVDPTACMHASPTRQLRHRRESSRSSCSGALCACTSSTRP